MFRFILILLLLALPPRAHAATTSHLVIDVAPAQKLGAAARNDAGILLVYYRPHEPDLEVIFFAAGGGERRHTVRTVRRVYDAPVIAQLSDRFVVAANTYREPDGTIEAFALARDGSAIDWSRTLITRDGFIGRVATRAANDQFVLTFFRATKIEQQVFDRSGAPAGEPVLLVENQQFVGVVDEIFAPNGRPVLFWTSQYKCQTLCFSYPLDVYASEEAGRETIRNAVGTSFAYPSAASNRGAAWIAINSTNGEREIVELRRLSLTTPAPALVGAPIVLPRYSYVHELMPFGAGFLLVAVRIDEEFNAHTEALELSTNGHVLSTTYVDDDYYASFAPLGFNEGLVFEETVLGSVRRTLTILRPSHRTRAVQLPSDQ